MTRLAENLKWALRIASLYAGGKDRRVEAFFGLNPKLERWTNYHVPGLLPSQPEKNGRFPPFADGVVVK